LLRRCVWPGEVRCLNGSIAAGPTWTNVSGARRRIRCPGRAARLIAIDGGAEAIGSTDEHRWLVLLSGACAAPFHFLLRSIAAWLADGGGAAVGGVMCCRHHARRTALRDGSWAPLEGASMRWATRQRSTGSRGREPPGGGAGGGAPCRGVQGGGAPLLSTSEQPPAEAEEWSSYTHRAGQLIASQISPSSCAICALSVQSRQRLSNSPAAADLSL